MKIRNLFSFFTGWTHQLIHKPDPIRCSASLYMAAMWARMHHPAHLSSSAFSCRAHESGDLSPILQLCRLLVTVALRRCLPCESLLASVPACACFSRPSQPLARAHPMPDAAVVAPLCCLVTRATTPIPLRPTALV
jgi:hypothetical protein